MTVPLSDRIRSAWQGRISGCMLGKPVETLSMAKGFDALDGYLKKTDALPLRNYVPYVEGEKRVDAFKACCLGHICRSEPDDDIHYSVLALMLLENHGRALSTADVARAWLNHLPAAATFTAEREAYRTRLNKGHEWFSFGHEPGFDLGECADNPYNDWIGAQIRADVYGWVCPGDPELAARLATQDAQLSHREDGIYGAVMVAALGAAIPVSENLNLAVDKAVAFIPAASEAATAVRRGQSLAGDTAGAEKIRQTYPDMSPVHTLNNLAVVIWALLSWPDDFDAAIGEAVAAGWDTDCNGATVGGLWGMQGKPIPSKWTEPWCGRVGLNLAGQSEIQLDELVDRTLKLAGQL